MGSEGVQQDRSREGNRKVGGGSDEDGLEVRMKASVMICKRGLAVLRMQRLVLPWVRPLLSRPEGLYCL